MNIRLDESQDNSQQRGQYPSPTRWNLSCGQEWNPSGICGAFSVPVTVGRSEYSRFNVFVDHLGLMLICGVFSSLETHTLSRRQASRDTTVPLSKRR